MKRFGLITILLLILSLLLFATGIGLCFFSPLSLLLLLPALLLLLIACKKQRCGRDTELEGKRRALFEERYLLSKQCEAAYDDALEAKDEASLLDEKIEELKKKKEELCEKLAVIRRTEALIREAARKYGEGHSEQTLSYFKEHLSSLGEERFMRFHLADRFTPTLLEKEGYRSAEALSRAEKDTVTLSRSLALLSAMKIGETPPLLFDDPFLSYDDTRLGSALLALDHLAKEYQIIYLTCSHSRMP